MTSAGQEMPSIASGVSESRSPGHTAELAGAVLLLPLLLLYQSTVLDRVILTCFVVLMSRHQHQHVPLLLTCTKSSSAEGYGSRRGAHLSTTSRSGRNSHCSLLYSPLRMEKLLPL